MAKTIFKAQPRTITGKAVKKLRKQGQIPANVHGDIKTPLTIEVGEVAFEKLYDQVGDTGLVYLDIEGESKQRPVLIDEVELDSVTNKLLHVVFKQVSLKEKVSAEIPIELVGEVDVPDAVLMTIRDSIEVEALPTDFPEKIEVDVSGLSEVGDSILVSDLNIDASIVTILGLEELADKPVAVLQSQQQEEPEPEEVDESETEAAGTDTAGEGGEAASESTSEEDSEKTE